MIFMRFDFLPPSVNHAYFNLPRGGRTLTKQGKKFKTDVKARILERYYQDITKVKPNHPYGLAVVLTFADLTNKTWPREAKSRYKKIDASNRVKLLEDAVSDALGIDDSQIMCLYVEKQEGTIERTCVCVWDREVEHTEVAIAGLQSM